MERIQAPYLPLSLTTEERQFIFSYCSLQSSLYNSANSNQFPHFIQESEANYVSPVLSHRIVKTPTNGYRMFVNASVPLDPMALFNANGIWNHVLDLAPNLIIS